MTLKIHFYIRPEKAKKSNEAPVYLRLTAKERKAHSIGYSIDPKKWDKSGYRSKGKKPSDIQLNNHIQSIIGALRRIETNLINSGEIVTAAKALKLYTGKGNEGSSFIETYTEALQKMDLTVGLEEGVSAATVGRYRTVFKHFTQFLQFNYGLKDISLEELRYEHLKEFNLYLQTVRNIKNNTRVKHISILRAIIRGAVESGKLLRDPFMQWKGRLIHKERVRLTTEELNQLREHSMHSKRLDQVRDVFVFCCFTGLAYIDVYKLTGENLVEQNGKTYIYTFRQKTRSKCWIPLLKPALEILSKYEGHICRKMEGRLLPVKSNQKMNSYLKEVAGICGIEKNLTFHIARHTFATTVTLANDVPIETVSEMLGHKNISTTQHYAKMVQTKVDRDMDKLGDRFG